MGSNLTHGTKINIMLQKLLCKLGSHIWVVSHENGHSVDWSYKDGERITTNIDIKICLQKCLFCKKEKRETIN